MFLNSCSDEIVKACGCVIAVRGNRLTQEEAAKAHRQLSTQDISWQLSQHSFFKGWKPELISLQVSWSQEQSSIKRVNMTRVIRDPYGERCALINVFKVFREYNLTQSN